MGYHKYWNYKSVRDPLYGFIHLSKRESLLAGTPFMHRLTRIKQLAHTYLVYPSAVHTRFEHVLGALYMADRLCNCFEIDNKRKEIIRCAALLHDVGHGPYSHLFENIMVKVNGEKFTHEDATRVIIEKDPDIRNILQGRTNEDGPEFEDILADVLLLFKKGKNGMISEKVNPLDASILSGTIDADKLDYLRRDSYHIGSSYGEFDLERLLATMTSIKDNGKEYPVILAKGTPVLESFKLARYLMYVQVYQHHARLSADRMFLRSVELAIDEKFIDPKIFKLFNAEEKFLGNYSKLDDNSIYDLILNSVKGKNSIAVRIMRELKNRRLFKRAIAVEYDKLSNGIAKMNVLKKDPVELEKEIAKKSGVPRGLIIVHKENNEGGLKSYRTFGRITESGEIPLMYLDDKQVPHPYDDISPLTMRNEIPKTLYVFTDREHREQVALSCKNILKI